jgi:hypothetical protein
MRMIAQLTNVLSQILFKKETGNYEEAADEIDNALKNMLGLDLEFLSALSADNIISLIQISKDDAAANVKLIVTARLLKEKSEVDKLKSKEDSVNIYEYQKILKLYLKGILENKNDDLNLRDYYADVNEIVKITGDEIPPETRKKLLKFYELQDRS